MENFKPGLYLVAVPIGNLGDITLRAIACLKSVDIIAAEDTRNARKLLDLLDVPLNGRRVVSYHDHSSNKERANLVECINNGRSVAYISDAGTPIVSDPGHALVKDVLALNGHVTSLPGASSVLAALCVAGLPSDRFSFEGFVPNKTKARLEFLETLKARRMTSVCFETAKRLQKTLAAIDEVFSPGHQIAVCRELTKKFETVLRGSAKDILSKIEQGETIKGEIVLVLGPELGAELDDDALAAKISELLPTKGVKEISIELSEVYGVARKRVYALALDQKKQSET